jgi:TolA-binding protein
VGPTAANRGSIDVPEQVLKFAPQKERRNDSDPMDQSGHAILAMLQEAGRRLEAAEDRINQLKTEIERLQDRAVRAEMWLQLIQKEIEEKLIAQLPVRNR